MYESLLPQDEGELKIEADRLMSKECRTRGSEIQSQISYIKTRYGDEGVRRIEEKFVELGYPIEFNKIIFRE